MDKWFLIYTDPTEDCTVVENYSSKLEALEFAKLYAKRACTDLKVARLDCVLEPEVIFTETSYA